MNGFRNRCRGSTIASSDVVNAVHNKRFYAENIFIRIHGDWVLPSERSGLAPGSFSPVVGGVDSQA